MESSASNNSRNLVIVLAVLAVAFCGCSACALGGLWAAGLATFTATSSDGPGVRRIERFIGGVGRVTARDTVQQSFDVGADAQLEVDSGVGEVWIEAVDSRSIGVEATIVARGRSDEDAQANLDRVQLEMVPDGATVRVTVSVRDPESFLWADTPEVNLRIRVPLETSVDVEAGVGGVRMEGTRGDARIRSDVGRVLLREVVPDRSLVVETDVASIEFDGPIAAEAAYEFRSDVGRIEVRLPADSRFDLDARSEVGAVNLGFEVEGETTSQSLVGRSVRGTVNGGGGASVTARSDVGDVSVEPR